MNNLIGQSLGRYHILEQLGEGGMATVYKAYDTRLETDVAVKVIRTEEFSPNVLERSLKRFEREAKSLARLTHPNIVKVTDYGEFDGKPYLVMPYLPGGTLKERIRQGPLPWQEAVRLLLPIANALEYAHKQNLIHRDVKPANILLTESGQPMLTDFGVAKLFDIEETADLTGIGMGVGTPEYMAPEQWQGQVSAQTDVYALGVVLYEMITGKRPYTADTPAALLLKQANDPLPSPKSFVSGLPDEIEKVLIRALARETKNRYQEARQFISALESISQSQTPEPHGKVESHRRPMPWIRVGWVLVGCFALIAILVGSIWTGRNKNLASNPTKTSTLILPSLTPTPVVTVFATETASKLAIAKPTINLDESTFLALEDFEDETVQMYGFSEDSRWKIVDDGTGNKVYQADNRDGTGYAGFAFGSDEWKNYAVEYRVNYLNYPSEVGLQIRSDTGGRGYIVGWSTSELYLAYMTPTNWTRITTKFPPFQIQIWHTVRVIVFDDSIQVFIDKNRWINENDSKYRQGVLMVFVSAGSFIQVDDIKVWNLGK